ncbi:hypothetical protein F5144DRAFT_303989 [Chaetomium tenue]|uniref:Uncharacterized protein n=1 Tax=Chaetomium tenue TaxID=1854479 RepID=A0ACB7P539_9PEZI|nr:hypothetical protein F5144DRAFT_303989 [Chaetomium globosum]
MFVVIGGRLIYAQCSIPVTMIEFRGCCGSLGGLRPRVSRRRRRREFVREIRRGRSESFPIPLRQAVEGGAHGALRYRSSQRRCQPLFQGGLAARNHAALLFADVLEQAIYPLWPEAGTRFLSAVLGEPRDRRNPSKVHHREKEGKAKRRVDFLTPYQEMQRQSGVAGEIADSLLAVRSERLDAPAIGELRNEIRHSPGLWSSTSMSGIHRGRWRRPGKPPGSGRGGLEGGATGRVELEAACTPLIGQSHRSRS